MASLIHHLRHGYDYVADAIPALAGVAALPADQSAMLAAIGRALASVIVAGLVGSSTWLAGEEIGDRPEWH